MAAGSGVSVANLDRTRSSAFDVSRERRCSSSTANWKEYRPAAATSQRLSSTAVHTRGQADTATVDRAGRATASGVMGDTVEERARAATWVAPGRDQHGLAGLQLQLGMGTPALRWSLLEVLRCVCCVRGVHWTASLWCYPPPEISEPVVICWRRTGCHHWRSLMFVVFAVHGFVAFGFSRRLRAKCYFFSLTLYNSRVTPLRCAEWGGQTVSPTPD